MRICLFVILLIFSSCRNNRAEKELVNLIQEWHGKEIVFPDSLVFTRYATGATDYRIPDSEYKVLAYVDSAGCTDCLLNLQAWIGFIESADTLTGAAVPFLFFFHPKEKRGVEELIYLLEMYRFDLPVCIDKEDALNKLNHFPENINFHVFLLDRDNKVTVIGNPVYSNEVKELYIKQIQQETEGKQRGEPALGISQRRASPLQPSTEGGAKDKKKMAFAEQ
jgi:hypothetical protein